MSVNLPGLDDPKLPELLKSGAVGAMPSDTIYGLMAVAANSAAVTKLYKLKSRDKKPGTIIAASVEQLVELGLKRRYLKAVDQYWPGAVTIIIPTDNPTLSYLDQGVGSLAVRVIDDTKLAKLLVQTGPLVTSSANHPGQMPADTIADAQRYFGDQADFYVDGGNLSGKQPSTIIRIVDDAVEVLRRGAVTISTND